MTLTRNNVLDQARSWLGVPFLHQGRSRVGVDCVGLLIAVARSVGYEVMDLDAYKRTPQPSVMGALLAQNADEIPISEMLPGDVFWMRMGGIKPRHTAFLNSGGDSPTIIHASTNGVRVQPLSDFPSVWFYKGFRMRGIS